MWLLWIDYRGEDGPPVRSTGYKNARVMKKAENECMPPLKGGRWVEINFAKDRLLVGNFPSRYPEIRTRGFPELIQCISVFAVSNLVWYGFFKQ